jgi:hypothetical protein
MSKVLRLWAPPGEDSASALFGHIAEKTEAGLGVYFDFCWIGLSV